MNLGCLSENLDEKNKFKEENNSNNRQDFVGSSKRKRGGKKIDSEGSEAAKSKFQLPATRKAAPLLPISDTVLYLSSCCGYFSIN